MAKVVGVKFKEAGKMYYFSPADIKVKAGDNVIVETARGLEFGKVTLDETEVSDSSLVAPLKNVVRIATPADEKKNESNLAKKEETLRICQEKIDALMPTLNASEGQVAGFVADMTKEEDIRKFVEDAKAHFGTLDIIIPNAGYEGKAHPVQDMTLELFEQTYMMNVFAVMLTMKYAAPTLIEKQSGSVVVIASAAAFEPTAGNSAYVSSKYAVAGLTKCVAMELGPVGVHVNYICPGPVDTPMMLRIEKDFFGDTMTHEEAMAMLASNYAMDKRYAKPEEIANAALYLASEVSAHTAGMGMHIDSKVAQAN